MKAQFKASLFNKIIRPYLPIRHMPTSSGMKTPDDLYRLDSVASLIAPHEQERLLQYQEALLAGEWAPEHYEYQGIRQDGTFVWLDIKVRKMLWNESPAIQSVVYDITQRKCAEAERKRLEEQLRQSQKMETMGALASGIDHDFNNILTAIFANTELAQALIPSDSPVQTHHHEILNATERAKTLVQQILTFSHQTAVQRQAVALAPLIHETFSLLRASLPSTIDFRYNLSEEVGCVNGDPTQLQQVLVNLCTNAEHAMRTTGGLLELRVKALELSDTDVAQGHSACTRIVPSSDSEGYRLGYRARGTGP
ncbi:hypothetical protein C2W62_46545 [Candidatus Entotheonella serta]|nr:hypothetical protein C2W62_46545 [Candidatus Entotheonella serta]